MCRFAVVIRAGLLIVTLAGGCAQAEGLAENLAAGVGLGETLDPGGGNAQPAVATGNVPQQSAPLVPDRGERTPLGNDEYHAACKNFVPLAAQQQDTDVWCWAACVQMVSRYNGHEVSQADIVKRIHGNAMDASGQLIADRVKRAGTYEIMLALNPDIQDAVTQDLLSRLLAGDLDLKYDAKGTLAALFQQMSYDENHMIADVARGSPVVVGLNDAGGRTGHAYAVYATNYSAAATPSLPLPGVASSPVYTLKSVDAVDPWTGKSVTITAADFAARVGFMISKEQARKVLTQHYGAIKFR